MDSLVFEFGRSSIWNAHNSTTRRAFNLEIQKQHFVECNKLSKTFRLEIYFIAYFAFRYFIVTESLQQITKLAFS